MRRPEVLIVLAASFAIAFSGCGTLSTADPRTEIERVVAKDGAPVRDLTGHENVWQHAYDRWDKAYRSGQAAAFRIAEQHEIPVMSREADAMYRAAVSIDDFGIRAQYTTLAKWFLRQTSAIVLVRDYVRLGDTARFGESVRRLDRIRSEGPTLVERFQNYYQRRFGTNPFSDVGTEAPRR